MDSVLSASTTNQERHHANYPECDLSGGNRVRLVSHLRERLSAPNGDQCSLASPELCLVGSGPLSPRRSLGGDRSSAGNFPSVSLVSRVSDWILVAQHAGLDTIQRLSGHALGRLFGVSGCRVTVISSMAPSCWNTGIRSTTDYWLADTADAALLLVRPISPWFGHRKSPPSSVTEPQGSVSLSVPTKENFCLTQRLYLSRLN